MSVTVRCGGCVEVLDGDAPDSYAACVTDPPYHLTSIVKRFGGENAAPARSNGASGVYGRASKGFMGKRWDGGDVAFRPETWAAVLRVLKPGAYLVAFASTRGYHRMVCAIEDAGFIIHPMLGWIFGSGFPKAHDLSKAIDRAAGAARPVVGVGKGRTGEASQPHGGSTFSDDAYQWPGDFDVTAPATDLARQWAGWAYGLQSLKPAIEPICLAQKPFADVTSDEIHALTGWDYWCSSRSDGEDRIITARSLRGEVRSYRARFDKQGRELSREDLGEYAPFVLDGGTANVLRHGTGALNIDAGRVEGPMDGVWGTSNATVNRERKFNGSPDMGEYRSAPHTSGRWPANLAHDGSPEVMEAFAAFGSDHVSKFTPPSERRNRQMGFGMTEGAGYGDTGTAARFFFCGKAQPWEREGSHPTVKPVALMEWLVKLVTPPNGVDFVCDTCNNTPYDDTPLQAVRGAVQQPQPPSDVLLSRVPGEEPDHTAHAMSSLREGGGAGEGDLLLGGMSQDGIEPSPNSISEALREVRNDLSADERRRSQVLLKEMLLPGGRNGEAEAGRDQDGQGLHPSSGARSSDGRSVRICDAAPADNGGALRQDSVTDGSRASPEWDQGRQPDREPSGDDRSSPQRRAKTGTEEHRVPLLRDSSEGIGTCPHCGNRLRRVERLSRVLDPFVGTGSTLVACDWLGIDAVGIDDDPQTCRDAEAKIKRLRARRMLGDAPKPEPVDQRQGSLL